MRKKIKIFVAICSLSYLSTSCSTSKKGEATKSNNNPNLVIFIADQWRGQALGFLNEDPVFTPHFDSFAKQSLVLKNFISNYPVCSPARATLMTGQYAFTNHVYDNVTSKTAPYNVQLATNAITWSDILHKNGYSLGYVGKWHLDSPHAPYIPTSNNRGAIKWNDWTPPNRRHGFDYWISYGTYDVHNKPMYWPTKGGREDYYYVNEWEPQYDVDKAIEFLENKNDTCRNAAQPFGLVVSVNPPHTGYKFHPQKYDELYKHIPIDQLTKDPNIPAANTPMGKQYRKDIKDYYACISGIDEQFGRLVNTLKQKHLLENTIILVIADHGNCLGKHNEITKNNIYEESLRVPFILYWKGHIQPGINTNCLMSYPDIYPTLLGLMNLDKQIPTVVQGQNNAPYILTKKGKYPTQQFILGNIQAPDSTSGFRGIRTQEYKLAYQKNKKGELQGFLFNLKIDPFEMHNLYKDNMKEVDKLKPKLLAWLEKMRDPFLRNF